MPLGPWADMWPRLRRSFRNSGLNSSTCSRRRALDMSRRTEFMPFAPVTLYEAREKCYHNIRGAEHSAEFMTITFDCTEFMRENCPAAVHVDGTARPQLVQRDVNPGYYDILKEYEKISGIPSLINTSFNMHEEPIVNTPQDAVRAFVQGALDYLAIGPFLVKQPNPAH